MHAGSHNRLWVHRLPHADHSRQAPHGQRPLVPYLRVATEVPSVSRTGRYTQALPNLSRLSAAPSRRRRPVADAEPQVRPEAQLFGEADASLHASALQRTALHTLARRCATCASHET